jgi:hypothetical protein
MGVLNQLVMDKIEVTLDKIIKDHTISSTTLLKILAEKLKFLGSKVSDEVVLKIVKGLSGISDVTRYIPRLDSSDLEISTKVIKTLYNSGNINDMHNAVMWDISNKTDILTNDEIFKWGEDQMNKGYYFTVNGYLAHSKKFRAVYDRLFALNPLELSQATHLPTESMVNYAISQKDTSSLPIQSWMRELINHYHTGKPEAEKAKDLFVKLAIQNPSRLQSVDHIDGDVQLAIVSKRPRAFEYMSPYKATLDKVIELKGDIGRSWVEADAKKKGYYDAWVQGGLR